jgi:cell division protein FtsW
MKKKTSSSLFICCFIVSILVMIGALFVYSTSSIYALDQHGVADFYFKRHVWGIAIGIIASLIFYVLPSKLLYRLSGVIFCGSLLLSFATFISSYGVTINGAHRWLRLPGLLFQPTELLRIFFPLHISGLYTHFSLRAQQKYLYFSFVITMILVSFLLLKQPDFGLLVTLTLTLSAMFFLHAKTVRCPMIFIGFIGLCASVLIFISPYRLRRLLIFLDPWQDAQGSGFQIIQSLVAIGSGHWFGLGISHSKQKFFYLPMQHTDFIFSIIAEEVGFVGAGIVVMLFMLFTFFGIRLSLSQSSLFAQQTVFGSIMIITIQGLINLAVTLALVPTKGTGLPFVSYGNSALISNFILMGIVANFSRSIR